MALACAAAACGGAASGQRFTADPRHYLLTLDQMPSPDFTVASAPARLDAATVADNNAQITLRLARDGLAAAARVTFARSVDFATANGPVEAIDSVERFSSNDGAHASFSADVAARDAQQGEVAMSAGPLGDEAHADSLVATAPDGIQAVQVSLEWRVANVVVLLQVRGRYGGTRLDDALTPAHGQTAAQLR